MLQRSVFAVLAFALFSLALASTSLSTGAVLPGWERLRSGPLVDQAKDIIRSYARQVDGVSCVTQDVHYKEGASLITRSIHVDMWFSSQGELVELLTDRDQHVLLLEPNYGIGSHLIVVFQLDNRNLLLAAC